MQAPNGKTNPLYQPLAEINVTPLVDVMLVLLIVFMVTAPLLATGMRVNLPQAKAQSVEAKEPLVLTIAKDGSLQLGAQDVARADLIATIRSKIGDDNATVIHLRGDRDANYGEIVEVMGELAEAGFARIALITSRPLGDQARPTRPVP
jgi:biopolymer transport protein TolR